MAMERWLDNAPFFPFVFVFICFFSWCFFSLAFGFFLPLPLWSFCSVCFLCFFPPPNSLYVFVLCLFLFVPMVSGFSLAFIGRENALVILLISPRITILEMRISTVCSSMFEENKARLLETTHPYIGEAPCGREKLRPLAGLVEDKFDPHFGSDLVQFWLSRSPLGWERRGWIIGLETTAFVF